MRLDTAPPKFTQNSKTWVVYYIGSDPNEFAPLASLLEGLCYEQQPISLSCALYPDAKALLRQPSQSALLFFGPLNGSSEDDELDLLYFLRETLGNYQTRVFPCKQNSKAPDASSPWTLCLALEESIEASVYQDTSIRATVLAGLAVYQKYVSAISFDRCSPCKTPPRSAQASCELKWRCQPGWPIEYASLEVAQLLGYQAGELEEAGELLENLIYEADRPTFACNQELKSRVGKPQLEEYRVYNKSKQLIWVLSCTWVDTDFQGNPDSATTRWFINLDDATKTSSLMLEASVGLVQIDQTQKIIQINEALSEMIGAGYPGVIGRNFSDWLSLAEKKRLQQYLELAQVSGQPQRFQLDIGLSRGRNLAMVYLSLSLLGNQKAWGFQLMTESLVLRQAKETALSQELQQERAFIASASHELRTPLSAVLGYAELLKNAKGLDTEQQSFLANIVTNSKHLVTLVNDILDLSKIESNQLSLNIEETVFSDLFTSSGVMISSQVKEGVKLIVTAPDLEHFVLCDPTRIKQIFLNLLSNAAKFTDHGTIKMYMDQYQSLDTSLFKVRICVEDTGPGIPKNKQNELFQPFKQVHARQQDGTGLGLYLSQRIATLMDGKITLKSDGGKGTAFYVDLVLTKGRVKGDQFAFDEKQIIIFGDYPSLNDQQKAKLHKTGAKIHFIDCTDSRNHDRLRDALAFVQVDVALIDVDVLKEKTPWYAGALKETFPSIALVGLKTESCQTQCDLLDQILLKPFSYYQLASVLDEEISRYRPAEKMDYANLRVLIVEDVEANRMLFSQMFQRFFNLQPSLAVSGTDAVQQVRQGDFDLVFMDVEMPDMDGLEATQKIREFDPTTPIVAMTGNVFTEDIQATKDAGMTGFLSKPIQKEDLERAMITQLDQHPTEPPLFADDDRAAIRLSTAGPHLQETPLERMKADMYTHLAELSDDRAILTEIVETAVEEIQETFSQIVELNGRKDQEGLTKALHKLKGILLNMDVQPQSKQIGELEIKIKSGEGEQLLGEFIQQFSQLSKAP